MFPLLKIRVFALVFLTFSATNSFAEDIKAFSVLPDNNLMSNDKFIVKIQEIIITQPEFRQAIAVKGEFQENRKFASRQRFPSLTAQIINDRTISLSLIHI